MNVERELRCPICENPAFRPQEAANLLDEEGVSIQCVCERGCNFSILMYFYKGCCYLEPAPPNSYYAKESFVNTPYIKPLFN